jgi:protein-tyrosine-phosphatase/predicted ATP-grasp superfamily ATP-dependent carboligase
MPARALVLDADSDAALETAQALGRKGVIVDVSAPGDCTSFRSRYVTGKFLQPDVRGGVSFHKWIHDLDDRANYDLVVPSTERTLPALRRFDPEDSIRLRAVLPSNWALDVALNKQRTWELASELGIPVPDSVLIESMEGLPPAPRYPIILKTTRSVISARDYDVMGGTALVGYPQARLVFLRRHLPYGSIQQQLWVPGHSFGIELLYRHGKLLWHFAHERIHEGFLWGGASSYLRSIAPPENLFQAATQLLNRLHWHGVAMVEFRAQQQGTFHLMEINPRLCGSLALALDAGVDFPWGLLRIARAETIPPQPEYRTHYYTRNLAQDIRWQLANLKANHSDPTLLTRPRALTFLEIFRPLIGRESWDFFDWRDLTVTSAQLRSIVLHLTAAVRQRWNRRRLGRKIARHHRRQFHGSSDAHQVKAILFLCSGNLCRSPFAAELARQKLPGYRIDSAGLRANGRRGTPDEIQDVARLNGVELGTHTSKPVTREQLYDADIVLVMDLDNYQSVLSRWPEAAARTTLLGLFASQEQLVISDPYGVSTHEAAKIFATMVEAVEGLSDWLSRRASV